MFYIYSLCFIFILFQLKYIGKYLNCKNAIKITAITTIVITCMYVYILSASYYIKY